MNVKQLKDSVREIQEDKAKAKNLLDIVQLLKNPEDKKCPKLKAVHALQKALSHVIDRGDFDDGNTKYRTWLTGVYDETWQCLLTCVDSLDRKLSTQSIATIMHLWAAKSNSQKGEESDGTELGSEEHKKLRGILVRLTCSGKDAGAAIERFGEKLAYTDISAYTIQHLAKILHSVKTLSDDSERKSKNTVQFRRNVMRLLELMRYPYDKENSFVANLLRTKSPPPAEEIQQSFTNMWVDFFWLMGGDTNVDIYKRVLIILHDRVLPHLTKPLLLTDFLMESYDVGGSISLLALNGVFHLIQKYNLEYPDFYKKLYALFTPEVLHVKYRARFFHLSDLFLRSPLLPEYLVAAFVKRLSRLALTAPANTITMVLQFIGNLLLRHQGLQKMANFTNATNEEDPYVMEESDPASCGASASRLWEVATLASSHALPQVAHAAKLILKLHNSGSSEAPVAQPEWNVNDILEDTYQDMFEVETKKKVFVNVPLTFERPQGFNLPNHEIVSSLFA